MFGGNIVNSLNSNSVSRTEQLLGSWVCSSEVVMSFLGFFSGEIHIPSIILALVKLQNFLLEEFRFITSLQIRLSTCLQ